MTLTAHYAAFRQDREVGSSAVPGAWMVAAGAEWTFGQAVPGGGITRGDALTVGHIRREVRERLGAWRLLPLVDDVCVVLSELVTNAIRYGDGYFAVRMSRLKIGECSELHLEVWDRSTDLPRVHLVGPDAESGRGLLLVIGLVKELGGTYGVSDDGRRTWCTIPAQRAA